MKHHRVCIIRRAYYPADNHVRRNADSLIAAGYKVDIICLRNRGEPTTETIDSVNVHRLPMRARRSGLLAYFVEYVSFFLMAVVTVSFLHLRHPYTVIEADSMPDFLIFTGILSHLTGAHLILYLFESMPELWAQKWGVSMSHWTIRLILWQERISCHFADAVICCHDMASDALIHRGIPDYKISVVLNVPDEHVLSLDRYGSQEGDGVFRLIQHGTITENYGIQVVLQALALLDPSIPVCFDVVGQGEYRSVLEDITNRLGLQDRVIFHGFVSTDRLLELLYRADAGIVPMLFEYQSPNKMFQFIALGKPVIASDRQTFQQYFDENEILYFRTGDPYDLSRVIESAFRCSDETREYVRRASKRFEGYRWSKMRERYLEVYRRLSHKNQSD
jgi:glycosyltransferase involved in cell wall biosynthesis